MPEKEHPLNVIPAIPLPSPEAQVTRHVINSRERSLREGKTTSEYQDAFHPVKHKNELSETDMQAYFKLSDDLE